MLSRRETLLGLTASASVLAASPSRAAVRHPPIPYGAALRLSALDADPAYGPAFAGHCALAVCEGGMKWIDLRPGPDVFAFGDADRQVAFAGRHGIAMRGHTLVWYGAMPDWTKTIGVKEAERALVSHIGTVMDRYREKIRCWDVVNEPVADDPAHARDLRPSLWLDRLGPSYVDLALRAAAKADPTARLVVNEYDIESVGPRFRRRREAFLTLIRDLREKNTPLHAVGLQGHLHGDLPIDKHGLSAFVAEVHAMGLGVIVTELDVIDDRLPKAVAARDAAAAARAQDFLQAIQDAARPLAVLTWGISDKYTWVPMWFARRDGTPNRPLPLDALYQKKPLMQVIERFTGGEA